MKLLAELSLSDAVDGTTADNTAGESGSDASGEL